MRTYITELCEGGHHSTAKSYQDALNSFKRFSGREEIPYTYINNENLLFYQNYEEMLEQPREMGEMTLKDFVPMSLRCQMRSNRKSGKCKEKQNIAGERFANHYPRRCKI